jgi:hypothetical protein
VHTVSLYAVSGDQIAKAPPAHHFCHFGPLPGEWRNVSTGGQPKSVLDHSRAEQGAGHHPRAGSFGRAPAAARAADAPAGARLVARTPWPPAGDSPWPPPIGPAPTGGDAPPRARGGPATVHPVPLVSVLVSVADAIGVADADSGDILAPPRYAHLSAAGRPVHQVAHGRMENVRRGPFSPPFPQPVTSIIQYWLTITCGRLSMAWRQPCRAVGSALKLLNSQSRPVVVEKGAVVLV